MALALGALVAVALIPLVTRAQTNPTVIAMPGGSFESPVYGTSPFYGYQPANSEWTWSGLAGIQRNGSGLGASNAPAPGSQTAFLQGSGTAGNQGAFSQNVTLTAGTYKVTFKSAQRATGNAVPIQIKMDGTALGAPITPTGTTYATYASVPFIVGASGGTYRLGLSTTSNSGASMSLIDNIAIEVAQPVASGGFETPVTSSYGYQPANSDWTWSGLAGIQHNGSLGADAPEGVQTAFLQGSGTASQIGAFSCNVTLAAGTYKVTFKAAQRATGNAVPIQVTLDSSTIGTAITPGSTAFASYSTATFPVTVGTHLLKFSTTSNSGGSMSLIDDIRVDLASAPPIILPGPVAPSAPTDLTATSAANQVTLNWSAVSRATGYKVKRATALNGPYTTSVNTLSSPTFTEGGLAYGPTYYYRVYALNAGNNGDDSEAASVTPLAAPVATTRGGNNQISVDWSAIAGATGYRVTASTSANSAPFYTTTVSGLTATQLGLSSGTTYFYRVVALNTTGTSTSTQVSGITLPAAPGNVTLNPGDGRITLRWNAVTGATGYKVRRSIGAGGAYATLTPDVSGTTFTDAPLANGVTFSYRIYAVNASGNGPESNAYSATTLAVPAAPANVVATPHDAKVSLLWGAVPGATSYNVERSTAAGGSYQLLVSFHPDTAFEDTAVTNGRTYYYRVSGVNDSGVGNPSTPVSATPVAPPTGVPANLTAQGGDGQVSLSWGAVSGATSYQIRGSETSNANYPNYFEQRTSGPATAFVISPLPNGTTYYFRVQAVNDSGYGPLSAEMSATPRALPAAPSLSATAENKSATLYWNRVNDAASYRVRRRIGANGTYTTLSNVITDTSFTNGNLTNGTTYYYRIFAVNSSGNSPESNEVAVTPMAPTPTPAPTATPTPAPTATPTPAPTATPTPAPVAPTPTPTATPMPTATPTPAPTATPIPVAPTRRVDLSIEAINSGQGEVGANDYYPEVIQEAMYSITDRGKAIFRLTVYNRGTASDDIRLSGRGDTPGWKVRYFSDFGGVTDISAQVKSNTYIISGLAPQNSRNFRVEVTPDASVPLNQSKAVPIAGYSESDSAARDQVTATSVPTSAPLPIYRPDSLVRVVGQADYRGEGIYDFMASEEQTVSSTASSGVAAVYNLKITNQGNVADSFKFKLPLAKQGWSLSLYDARSGGTNITGIAQQQSGFNTGSLAPQQFKEFRLEVKPNAGTIGLFSISIMTISFTDDTMQDVATFDTTVGNVSASATVTFTGSSRACAGGIDNALHKLTLTLHATNNGANLTNAPIALSFENNVGHKRVVEGVIRTPYKAKILDPNESVAANRWKESVTLTTDDNGDVQVEVLSSDVISQPRLVARWQNAIVSSLVCDFAAATSKRGFPDPVVGTYNGWQNDDFGWTCNFQNLKSVGDTTTAELHLKFLGSSGIYQSVAGQQVAISFAQLSLGEDSHLYDPDEASKYIAFVSNGTEFNQVVATSDSNGVVQVTIKAKAGYSLVTAVQFSAINVSQWKN